MSAGQAIPLPPPGALPASAGVGAPAALKVELIDDPAALERLRPTWEVLNAAGQDHESAFFLSHAWTSHVAKVRHGGAHRDWRMCVAVVRVGGDIAGIWPLCIVRSGGLKVARCLDDPFGQFAGVVFADRALIGPGVQAVLAALRRTGTADCAAIDHVVVGTPLHDALIQAGARTAQIGQSVVVDLRPFESHKVYLSSVGLKTRKTHRNNLNRLSRLGPTDSRVCEDRAALSEIIHYTFDRRLDWLDQHGTTAPAFRDADFRGIVEGLPSVAGLTLRAFDLRLGGEVVARQWGFIYQNRYYAYLSARNEAYDAVGPGSVHLGLVIEAEMAAGREVLELMGPASPYKMRWTDTTKPIADLVLPLSTRGKLWASGWQLGLKPMIRGVYHALPLKVRSQIGAHLNRR